MLAPNVWPRNTVRGDDGVVTIAGVPLTDIAAEFGTPVFAVSYTHLTLPTILRV